MSKEIEKPASIVKKELNQNLIDVINDSKLPLFVVEYVLKDLLIQVHDLAKQQEEDDIEKYNKELEEQEKNNTLEEKEES